MGKLTGTQVQELHRDHILQSWGKAGQNATPIAKAEGIYLYDYEGNKYADMSSLLVCTNLGHDNKDIIAALKEQADWMSFMAPSYATEAKSLLAKKLVDLAGPSFQRVFFTNSGAESNENAIKMARMVTGRTKIFSCYRSYHGATLGASNASGDSRRFAAELGGANGFIKFINPHMYQDGYT
nr:aminotransferase class III-fold pyridoxal phosphate-dependent enzyme [Enterococcus sp.]